MSSEDFKQNRACSVPEGSLFQRLLDSFAPYAPDSKGAFSEGAESAQGWSGLWAQAVWEADSAGRVVRDSPSWRNLTGQTLEGFVGYGWIAAICPEDRFWVEGQWRKAVQKRERLRIEFRLRAVADSGRWIQLRAEPLFKPDGRVEKWGVHCIDVTGHKRVCEALEKQNRRVELLQNALMRLMEAAPDFSLLEDLSVSLKRCFGVDAWVECSGRRGESSLEMTFSKSVPEEARSSAETKAFVHRLSTQAVASGRSILCGGILSNAEPELDGARRLGLRACACIPLPLKGESAGSILFASRQRDGFEPGEMECFESLVQCLALGRERVRQARVAACHTRGLELAVENRTSELRETFAELQQMSYSMVHDMRAPLRAMSSFAAILRERAAGRLEPEELEHLERIVSAAERLDHLILDARHYTRAVRQSLNLTFVDIGSLIREMIATYPRFQLPRADIRMKGEFPAVWANTSALTQCISHLLENAGKFARPGDVPRVCIRAELADVPEPGAVPVVRIWFEDNGVGIPAAMRSQVFELFQKAHGGYSGTGAGLALVRKLVERMGGRVGVESEEGQGSRFWIELVRGDKEQAES